MLDISYFKKNNSSYFLKFVFYNLHLYPKCFKRQNMFFMFPAYLKYKTKINVIKNRNHKLSLLRQQENIWTWQRDVKDLFTMGCHDNHCQHIPPCWNKHCLTPDLRNPGPWPWFHSTIEYFNNWHTVLLPFVGENVTSAIRVLLHDKINTSQSEHGLCVSVSKLLTASLSVNHRVWSF